MHCVTDGAGVDPDAAGADAIPRKAIAAKSVPAATAAPRQRRTVPVPMLNRAFREDRGVPSDPLGESVLCVRRDLLEPRKGLWAYNDDNDQAENTIGPLLDTPK